MVKKIGAIMLAFILCLSVAVLPASAAGFDGSYTFAAGKTSAFRIELDKATYKPGDTVTVSVYFRFANDAAEIKSSYLTFGVNSAVFDNTDTANATITTATACDVWESYWKTPTSSLWAWCASGVTTRINKANTEVEKAKYDTYLRVSLAQDIDKVTDKTHGVVAGDLNNSQPLLTFKLKLRDGIAPGTAINIGMPSGAVTCAPAQTTVTLFTSPGSSTASKAQANTTYDVSEAVASASIAAAGPALTHAGRQVKMDVAGGAVVSGTEQLRVVSSISNDDWNNYFANTTVAAATTKKLLEVGIVATQGAFDMTAAQDAAKLGKGVHGDYTVATTTYIQNTGSDYRFGARIEYQTNVFDTTYVAFAKYLNAEGAEAYVFYDASYALAFATNYSTITADYINFLNSQAA